MTMEPVYNPHQQQQHGFQQQAVDQRTSAHASHLNQINHVQQQAIRLQSSSPPPPPPPLSTMVHQQHQQHNHNNFAHHIQHSTTLQSNPYQAHNLGNDQFSHEHDRHPQIHRPLHPPPRPPQSQQSQSILVRQQPQLQSHPVTSYPHSMVPPMRLSEEESRSATSVMRNSLPAATNRTTDSEAEIAHRNSLQTSYYANTRYQYYQPSNLRRHPTHHNKYITDQQQLLQHHHTESHHASLGIVHPSESRQSDNGAFDAVDHGSQDSCTDKVIRPILDAKDALEKPIEERDERDVLIIDKLCSIVHGFDVFSRKVRRALAAQTVLIVIDEKGKELIVHNEELDSFCVLIYGECEQLDETKTRTIRYYNVGDAFGVCEPTTETIRFVGHMVTRCENCAFLCVKRDDFYTILTDSANYPRELKHRDHNGSIVSISQFNVDKASPDSQWSYHMRSKPFKVFMPDGHIIVKATESCLLTSLVDGYERLDPDYIDDFLLLFRIFMSWDVKDKEKHLPPGMIRLCLTLARWLESAEYRDRVVKVVLTWLSSYYHDFERNSEFSYLFFRLLESRLLSLAMNNQLHLLHVTLSTKSKIRPVTISRSSREQPLAFAIAGGYEKNCGIFVTQVHGSNAEDSPFDSLISYLSHQPGGAADKINNGPVIPPRNKSLNQNFNYNDHSTLKILTELKPGDQILEVNGTNFCAIKLVEAQKWLDMWTHLSLKVKYNPSAFHEMRALPEGRRKSSMSSLSSVSPFPQHAQKFTFNLHEQLVSKNGGDACPPASPLISANANFGFKSIMRGAPKNDKSRLSNLISSSRQLVKHMRESTTAQSANAETGSKASDNISDDLQTIDSDLSKIKSNLDLHNLKGKGKQIDYGLANVVRSDQYGLATGNDAVNNGSSNRALVNVMRIFNAANNDSRYLLIHEEMTAREVVMVAVKEFNLSSSSNNGSTNSPGEKSVSSLNWHLYEVSVVPESRTIKQKCIPEQASRLAENESLCSRYYIKNNSQNSLGPTKLDMGDDALVNEILKESPANVSLTSLNPTLLAVELTLTDFDKFRSIEPQQFVYDTFFNCSEKQKQISNTNGSISSHDSASLKSSSSESQDSSDLLHTMNKTRSIPSDWMREYRQFADISNREMFWVICEILNERNIGRRVKIIKQFVHVADVCSRLRNYNSMFAIISGLGHSCVARLRRTFDKLKPKYKNQLDEMRKLFDPSKNMSNYRTCLSQAQPPTIPLFPQIKKDLTFTKEGRSIFVREPNDLSDDDETDFPQDTIRRKSRGDLLSVGSTTMHPNNCTEKAHHLPVAQTRTIAFSNTLSNSQKTVNSDADNILVNFADIRQFTDRVRNIIYFSSVPYSNDLLTDTKDSLRNQAQTKKMHEECQMRKRIRHYISQTLAGSSLESAQNSTAPSAASSGDKLDQIDGPSSSSKPSGKLVISYDERTLYQKSLQVEPELNARPHVASNEPRQTGTITATNVAAAVRATQLPPLHVAPMPIIAPLQPTIANSSPTLSKSSSLSSCSSFSHHLPSYHAVRAGSNLSSGVGKFGTESTESLRKLKALSENVDDWRSSSCNTNSSAAAAGATATTNNNHLGVTNQASNGLSRIASDGRVGLARNLVPSRIFPPKSK